MKVVAGIILWLLPVVAFAQPTIIVRAGEHEEFTRITFALDEQMGWSKAQNSLVFEGDEVRFDTSQAFSRIGRDRLAGVQISQGRVTLDLGCHCDIRAFQASDRLVAVDILPSEQPLEKEPDPQASLPVTLSALSLLKIPTDEAAISEHNRMIETHSEPVSIETEQSTQLPVENNVGGVAEAIARAATLGLVSPISEQASFDSADKAISDGLAAALMQANARVGSLEAGVTGGPHVKNPDCPTSEVFPRLSANSDLVIGNEIRDLVTQSGKVDPEQVVDAADMYLSLGFGVEAQSVLSISDNPSNQPYRWAIAAYLDHGQANDHPFKTAHLLCDADVALWALAILHEQADTDGLDLAALVASFQRWPKDVRAVVGPELSSILVQRDRHDLARTVLRVADFSDDPIASALAHAELEAAQGRPDLALSLLEDLPSTVEAQSPEYVVGRINLRLENGSSIPDRDIETARSLLKEHQDLPVGQKLQDTLVAAYIHNGDLKSAIDVFDQHPLASGQIEMLFGHALRKLPPEDFAWFIFAYWIGNEEHFPEDLNLEVTASLKALGFDAHASSSMASERGRLAHILSSDLSPLVPVKPIERISVDWSLGLSTKTREQIREIERVFAELEGRL